MKDKQIGDYKILKQIGAGGMARVYLGVHKDVPNLKVVLKVLSDPRQAERFKQEADKLALLDRHPNICKIKHFFNHGDELVIVMEYIEGKTLKQILDEKEKLPIAEALNITCDIISALEPAHKQGIYHRDIKPGNIMFKESGQVKIIDFGIAKAKTDPSLTIVGTSAGTPDYMAPEQFDASEDIDYSKSDIYAVGTMLFRMLTGELPFKGENEFALRDAKLFETPPKPSKLNNEITRELDHIILKSINSEPAKRFDSVGEMRDKLQEVYKTCKIEETLTSIEKPEQEGRPERKESRGKPRALYISIAVVILVAAAVYFLLIKPGLAKQGKIDVTITPASNLYLDGRLIGSSTSVQSLSLEPGMHIIRVVNESSLFEKEIVDTIQLAGGGKIRRDYSFRGAMDISITPAGSLFIDNTLISPSTTGESVPLQPGRHIIRVKNERAVNKKEFVDTIQLAANMKLARNYAFTLPPPTKEKDLRVHQEVSRADQEIVSNKDGSDDETPAEQPPPASGSLVILSSPLGGDIYIDGVLQEYKTPYTFDLPPGKHTVRIRVEKNGRTVDSLYTITIESGKKEKINFKPLE
jgi:serine/threonine protein kinase